MKKVAAVFSILFIFSSLAIAQTAPNVTFSPPVQFMDDWAIYTLADWESYPDLYTIYIHNNEDATVSGIFMEVEISVFGSIDPELQDGVIAWGITYPIEIPSGGTVMYKNDQDFKYNQLNINEFNEAFEDAVLSTGNSLPAGTYRYQFRLLFDENTPPNYNNAIDLSEYYPDAICSKEVVITSPNDPELVSPGDASDEGFSIYETNPTFQFLSAGANAGSRIYYSLKICNKAEGQSNDEAIENLPFFELSWDDATENLETGIITPIIYPYPASADNFLNGKYVWQAFAKSYRNISDPSAGFSGESEIFCFQYGDIPEPVFPPDGSDVIGTTTTFSWTMALGADGYLIRFGDSNDPTLESYYFDEEVAGTFFDHVPNEVPLVVGETYYWKVKALPFGYWSEISSFKCGTYDELDYEIEITILIDPMNPTHPKFFWEPVLDAGSYQVFVSNEQNYENYFWDNITLSNNQAYPDDAPALQHGETYFVWLMPLDMVGEIYRDFSLPYTFEIPEIEEGEESKISLLSPVNEIVYTLYPTLIWSVYPDASSYNLSIYEDAEMTIPLLSKSGISENTYSFSSSDETDLKFGNTYYWMVSAVDEIDEVIAQADAVAEFYITNAVSELIYPLNSVVNNLTPNFIWYLIPGCNKYSIEISTDDEFNNLLWSSDEIMTNSVNYPQSDAEPLEFSTTYYWRITALDNNGEAIADPSETGSFTTPSGALEIEFFFEPDSE